MRQAEEQRLVQQFIAHPAVEALAEAVLHRLARRDVMPFYAHLPAPCQHRIAGQLGAIVTDDHPRLAALGNQLRQLAHDTTARDRGVRHRRSEEHTSELQSLMRNSYAVFCLKKKKNNKTMHKYNIYKQQH